MSQEFVVRMPKETKKSYHMMRFNSALNVDVTKWKSPKMERENNLREFKTETEAPNFGAGSEFGKEARDEARKKKYGSHMKKYNPNDQPWILKVGGKHVKKFKGIRDGGVSENASYYVFFQAPDGAFEAHPVEEWYNFMPINRFKTYTAEEAEAEFENRHNVMNHHHLIKKFREKKEEEEKVAKSEIKIKKEEKKSLKVSEFDEWGDNEDERDGDEDEDGEEREGKKKVKKGKVKKQVKSRKKKKKGADDSDDGDSEPLEESDEGDFDADEVDYMSNSSSSGSESENEKLNRQMKGVEDEDGLRKLHSDDDEEEEDEDKDKEKNGKSGDAEKKEGEVKSVDKSGKKENDGKSGIKVERISSSSSSSDSDDSDLDESKSALFMQTKLSKSSRIKVESDHSTSNSRSATPTSSIDPQTPESSKSSKRKHNSSTAEASTSSASSKKFKPTGERGDSSINGITEDAIRRYLMRKPMTSYDLLTKFKGKTSLSKTELVVAIAQLLKRINPESRNIKDKLYFSIKK